MSRKPKRLIAVVIAAAVIAAASFNAYFIREDTGGILIWNANEAYLFFNITSRGHYVKWLRYPWFSIKEYLGAIEDPDDDRGSLIVVRVTSFGVERHILKVENRGPGSGPNFITPLEGHIYANYPAVGGLCRWAGDHFEPATQEERRRLDGINRLTVSNIDHDDMGWSKRGLGGGLQDNRFTIDVGDKFQLSITSLAERNDTNGAVSIDVLRPGQPPKRIWDFQARRGMVSWAEYKLTFR